MFQIGLKKNFLLVNRIHIGFHHPDPPGALLDPGQTVIKIIQTVAVAHAGFLLFGYDQCITNDFQINGKLTRTAIEASIYMLDRQST
jgi:hypothetical protein